MGDIIAIYNNAGVLQGGYAYDAYGNTTITGPNTGGICNWNPWRYRGYYQDQETGCCHNYD